MHRGKVDLGVSELPRGNELSRDHVNRPLELVLKFQFKVSFASFEVPSQSLEVRGTREPF